MKKVSNQLWVFLWMAFFCILFSFPSFSQKALPMVFGEVDIKDISMKTYDKDPSAEAIILCEYGETSIEVLDGAKDRVSYDYHFRYKILKKEGLDWANIKIYTSAYTDDREVVTNIKCLTHNLENGVVVKTPLAKENIYETKLSKYRWQTSFSLPNVKEGSVIEISYTVISNYLISLRPWYFQTRIPTLWSEYRMRAPAYYQYVQLGNLLTPYYINEKIPTIDAHRWVMKDLPAFKEEKYITNVSDYLNEIEFQLASVSYPGQGTQAFIDDWKSFVNKLIKNDYYYGFMNKKGAYKDIVAQVIAGKTTPKDKMNAIFEYVKTNFQYNDEDYWFTDMSMKDVLEKKTGGSAEINLLLAGMLKEAELEVYPVLLSTRSHGLVNTTYPVIRKFNYSVVLVKIDKEEFLLDATNPMYPVNMIAFKALNKEGLAMATGGIFFWVPLQASKNTKSTTTVIGNLTLNNEGLITGDATTHHTGYEALNRRIKIMRIEKENKSETEEDIEFKNQTFKNTKEYGKPLESAKSVKITDFSQVNGDVIYISPLLDYHWKENPFKQETRLYPVDFAYAFDEHIVLNYTIPEGYVIEELPKSVRLQWNDNSIKFDYFVKGEGNQIKVMSKLTINRAVFQPEEYKNLRDMFAQILRKQEEQIVLKKK